MSELYYIQRIPSGYLGNSPNWWAKDGRGYTAYILGAERFTQEAAFKLVKEDPEKWKAFACDDVDERLHLIYDMQDNRRLGTDAPCAWDSGYAENPYSGSKDELLEALEKIVEDKYGDPYNIARKAIEKYKGVS